jgi:hypothetical protein
VATRSRKVVKALSGKPGRALLGEAEDGVGVMRREVVDGLDTPGRVGLTLYPVSLLGPPGVRCRGVPTVAPVKQAEAKRGSHAQPGW